MIQALLDWMADAVGRETPIHFSAYRPMGGFTEPPTPPATVHRAVAMAREGGFARVLAGNV
jgi:pyruvate formate lyase activating enzyme